MGAAAAAVVRRNIFRGNKGSSDLSPFPFSLRLRLPPPPTEVHQSSASPVLPFTSATPSPDTKLLGDTLGCFRVPRSRGRERRAGRTVGTCGI